VAKLQLFFDIGK